MKDEDKIARIAYASRTALIALQFVANRLIPDHDAGVFTYPAPTGGRNYCDAAVDYALGGFLRWDAQYFMHIARHGYTYENALAFFPFYPLAVSVAGRTVSPALIFCQLDSILLAVFVIVNVVVFKHAALALYKLTGALFDQRLAYGSAVLFCFNPASVFFVAPYTECVFSYLTFQSLTNCLSLHAKYAKPKAAFSIKDLLYLTPVALSTATRSNGLLNVGFPVYIVACSCLKGLKPNSPNLNVLRVVKHFAVAVVVAAFCVLPFAAYQYYCYRMFCDDFVANVGPAIIEHARRNGFVLPGEFAKHNQSWCHRSMPLAYSYVQDRYWNVGLLRYYRLKQVPNFLLALPALAITSRYCVKLLCVNFRRNPRFLLAFDPKGAGQGVYAAEGGVFALHALFLSVFCALFVHVQVSTRMLCSATPAFYWACADNVNLLKVPGRTDSPTELFFRTYFVSYFIAGTLLFCNFLPWT
ncbi:GPI mannosyltransferase 2 [Cylas formicarius]|uniref:GPI mannosyltransferase 2 n=1 Tax=Cylas formicarius TaxID=197179 RepID=UPI002958803F|nr:GPI mannosyltransferase 2 [Cylas formicarius]